MNFERQNIFARSSTADYIIFLTIAIVYTVFISIVVEKLVEDKTKHYNEYRDKAFSYNMALGVASLLAGGYVTAASDPSYATAGVGIALGGCLTIFSTTMINWNFITMNLKIAILGASLVALVYGSTYAY